MNINITGLFYKSAIDPLLSGLHREIIKNVPSELRILDIACGTGSLAMALSEKSKLITGIDLSKDSISMANHMVQKRGIQNVNFEIRDATDLSIYPDHSYDLAVTSMSVHQFDYNLAVRILREMSRIAPLLIVADYNFPLPSNLSGFLARSIEWFAGGDHYRNFRICNSSGGAEGIIKMAGLNPHKKIVKGNGVFAVFLCS